MATYSATVDQLGGVVLTAETHVTAQEALTGPEDLRLRVQAMHEMTLENRSLTKAATAGLSRHAVQPDLLGGYTVTTTLQTPDIQRPQPTPLDMHDLVATAKNDIIQQLSDEIGVLREEFHLFLEVLKEIRG